MCQTPRQRNETIVPKPMNKGTRESGVQRGTKEGHQCIWLPLEGKLLSYNMMVDVGLQGSHDTLT